MTFAQKSSIKKEISYKKEIESEITVLGLKLEEMKSKVDAYHDLTDEIEAAKKELIAIKSEETKVSCLLEAENNSFQRFKSETAKLEADKADNQAKIDAQITDISSNTDKITELLKEKTKAEKELQATRDIAIKAKNDLVVFNISAKDEKESAQREILKLVDEISSKQENKTSLNEALAMIGQDVKDWKETLSKQEEDIKKSNETKETLASDIEKLRADIFAERESHKRWINEETAKLNKREGELSIKENWLNEKTETLKANKEELEKFFNRKTNVNL